jgi:hypothetical protein
MMVAVLAVVLGAGSVLMASNMGFKLNKLLHKPAAGVSKSGSQYVALPYFRQTGLTKVGDLWNDIGGGTYLLAIKRLIEATDALQNYTGLSISNNYNLDEGVAYIVQLKAGAPSDLNYIIVGSHDPAFGATFEKPLAGVSKTGSNFFALPYNFTGAKVGDLWNDMGGGTNLLAIKRLVETTDALQNYTGLSISNNVTLSPGEGYVVQMKAAAPANLNYIASHY